jgi:uncharacterized damage-inducible protein DinB
MNRAALEALFAFTDFGWDLYERTLRPLGDETLLRPAPGSGWPALRDALTHINWGYVRWLSAPARTTGGARPEIRSWAELAELRTRVRGSARAYLERLSDRELIARVPFDVDGQILSYSAADLITHVLLHERQHHGDLNTLLYQLGIEIPNVEYRFSLG